MQIPSASVILCASLLACGQTASAPAPVSVSAAPPPASQDATALREADRAAAPQRERRTQPSASPTPPVAPGATVHQDAGAQTTEPDRTAAAAPDPDSLQTAADTSAAPAVTERSVPRERLSDTLQADNEAVATPVQVVAPPNHKPFDELIRRFVDPRGRVDYRALQLDPSVLRAYLISLAESPPTDEWSREQRLAYWINAYNAFTIDLIVRNWPVESIQDLDGGKPWDVRRIELGDKTYSLNQIENEVIRPQFQDPRIHFALNCAAASCPPLRQEAYFAKRIDAQLEGQAQRFVNNDAYNRLEGGTFTVSKVFEWYGEDFGDLEAYLRTYRELPEDVEIAYADYDWSINKQ